MFIYVLYTLSSICLLISFFKDKKKTRQALIKSLKSFENILPQLLSILLIIGIMLSIFDTNTISKLLGSSTGVLGVLLAAFVGSITLIPGFVAFPLASALLNNGAGLTQIAAFVSSLMMVGIVTLPMEIKTFGKKATLYRNTLAFFYSIFVAFIMGVIL